MPQTNELTRQEHYVPRMYLRRFCEPPKKNGKQAKRIWTYDTLEMHQKPISIESICFEQDLYEIKDANGNIVNQNQIENRLGKFEEYFSIILDSIVRRTKHDKNLLTRCFLTKEEKGLLIVWMYLQIARYPSTIALAEELAEEWLLEWVKPPGARNFAIWSCLESVLNGNIDMKKPGLFQHMIHWFADMAFVIGRCSQPLLFTCDSPVSLFQKDRDTIDFNTERPQRIIFPLDPTAVLIMVPYNQENVGKRNIMVNLADEWLQEAQWSMARSAKRWIFSSQRFTDKQIALIRSAREDIDG